MLKTINPLARKARRFFSNLGPDSLVPIEIEPRKTLGLLDPLQILRREVLAVLAEQIYAVLLHILVCLQVEHHVQSRPGIG
jgi:hypothetical protein